MTETTFRIEPLRLDPVPSALGDAVTDLVAASARLGNRLHPRSAASLASLVRTMNAYYTNLIEGHHTRPRDIERALAGEFDSDEGRRDLQIEAAAHVRLQERIDTLAAEEVLPEPTSRDFIRRLHRDFHENVPPSMLRIEGARGEIRMTPGEWRAGEDQDVSVGRHHPPASERVEAFMVRFEEAYRSARDRPGTRVLAIPAAHHRFNYIHPFVDGNGRVSRLMSHAMAHRAGIGAHGLWSVSRGLARGLESRADYKSWMDRADTPRQGDLDGRGNLSEKALQEFSLWFLAVCLDQVEFMSGLFELPRLLDRLRTLVERTDGLRPEAAALLGQVLVRGEIERGEAVAVTTLPTRSGQRVLSQLIEQGLLASDTPKGAVSLRFPAVTVETLFPRLYPES